MRLDLLRCDICRKPCFGSIWWAAWPERAIPEQKGNYCQPHFYMMQAQCPYKETVTARLKKEKKQVALF